MIYLKSICVGVAVLVASVYPSIDVLERKRKGIEHESHQFGGDDKIHRLNRVVPMQSNRVEPSEQIVVMLAASRR
jgi:hypothetical protein